MITGQCATDRGLLVTTVVRPAVAVGFVVFAAVVGVGEVETGVELEGLFEPVLEHAAHASTTSETSARARTVGRRSTGIFGSTRWGLRRLIDG